jgi:hypothetical protein
MPTPGEVFVRFFSCHVRQYPLLSDANEYGDFAVDTKELIRRWQQRQREILDTLAPELRAEYFRLEECIGAVGSEELRVACQKVREEIAEHLRAADEHENEVAILRRSLEDTKNKLADEELLFNQVSAGRPSNAVLIESILKRSSRVGPAPRTPLSEQKKKLIAFLKKHGRCVRGCIARGTGIPPGSLSALLQDEEFEQVQRGVWRLREEENPRHADPTSQ